MKDMVRVLGDVMNPIVYRHMFCSVLECFRFFFYERLFAAVKKEKRGSTREDPDEAGSKKEECESVELLPMLPIESPALHYTCVAGNYQPTAAAKSLSNTPLVYMATHFL